MKKCASCTKDLPEAALHCVFCGAKQPPAPAVQPGLAKTAFGYSNEMMEQLKQSGGQAPSPYNAPRPHPASQPPPSYAPPQQQNYHPPSQPPPYGAPAAAANAATVFVPGGPPQQPPPQQLPASPFAALPTQRHPPSQPPPSYNAGAYGNPAGYNPQPQQQGMGVHSPHQITPQPLPQVAPYGAPSRGSSPIEPWKDALPFMMIVWGVALLVAFATPVSTDPLGFNWDVIIHGEGTAKVPMLTIAAIGLLGVVFGAIPMMSLPRGILAAVLGLSGVLVPIFLAGMPPWQILVPLIGMIALIPGLLVRNEYTDSLFGRVLVTIGVVCMLVPLLIPANDSIPLVGLFKKLIDAPGEAKVGPILEIAGIVLVVMTLLVWMPGPATGGAKIFAWLLILYPVVVHFVTTLLAGHIGDHIKGAPFDVFASWVPVATCMVFVGYGMATVFGKQLE